MCARGQATIIIGVGIVEWRRGEEVKKGGSRGGSQTKLVPEEICVALRKEWGATRVERAPAPSERREVGGHRIRSSYMLGLK